MEGPEGVNVPVAISAGAPQEREPKIEQVATIVRADSLMNVITVLSLFFYHRYLVAKR